jgi:hypothetical protein
MKTVDAGTGEEDSGRCPWPGRLRQAYGHPPDGQRRSGPQSLARPAFDRLPSQPLAASSRLGG